MIILYSGLHRPSEFRWLRPLTRRLPVPLMATFVDLEKQTPPQVKLFRAAVRVAQGVR